MWAFDRVPRSQSIPRSGSNWSCLTVAERGKSLVSLAVGD
jgi:hypothetical protein